MVASWIEEILKHEGFAAAVITKNHTFNENGLKSHEVDVYCANPLIIAECTAAVGEDEQEKIAKNHPIKKILGLPGR